MKGLVIFLFALVLILKAKTFIVETYDANTPKKHISRGKRSSFFEDEIWNIFLEDYASADPPAWNKRRETIKKRCSSKTKKNVKFCERIKKVEWWVKAEMESNQ